MPADIRCLVEERPSYALVQVVGTLDVRGAVAVRDSLLKCLAEQPQALLVDLCRMRLADHGAMSVFLAVARQAARWPGVPIVLCGPAGDAADLLERRSVDQCVRVVTNVSAATRAMAVGEMPAPPSLTEDLLPTIGAGRRAREVATEACLRWHLPTLIGSTTTVVTELVNNVVAHAHTMMRLRVTLRQRFLHVTVTDGSTEPPLLRPAVSVDELSGRGLALVDTLATRWGHLPTGGGKAVWAMLALPDLPSGSGGHPAV
jgi:anti-anti-sigma regulatory factor